MNVPKLRFKDFDGEWEINLLKDITKINPKNEVLDDKFKYIDLEAVSNGVLINSKIINKIQAPSRAQRVVSKNDILYQTVRPYQKNNLFIDFENKNLQVVASTGYAQIRTDNKIDSKWLYQSMNTSKFTHHVLLRCTGTSYPAINSSDLGEIEVKFPKLEEQLKIGTFFEKMDKKIQLQQQKIDLLQEQKKGFLQKMFPKAGETQPEMRFDGFTGDWVEKSFSDIFDIHTDFVSNGSFQSLKENVKISNNESYAYMIRLQDAGNNWKGPWLYTDKKGFDFLKKSTVYENDIIMSDRGTIGKFFLVPKLDKPMTLSSNAVLLRSTKNINLFIFYLLNTKSVAIQIKIRTTPGVQPMISKTEFKKISTRLPESLEEQKKIAEFFTKIAEKINLEKVKLQELRKQKQGFMQQMFI